MADGASCPRTWLASSSLLFPAIALGSALVTAAAAPATSAWLFVLLGVALVPWALLAVHVALPDPVVAVATVAPAIAVVVHCGAVGAEFLVITAVMWMASRSPGRLLPAACAAAGTLAALVVDRRAGHHDARDWIFFGAGQLVAWLSGSLLRRERDLVLRLQEAHALLGRAAAAEERRRIARDVHDIVGHSLTVVLLNVAGARRLVRTDPDAAVEALELAEASGRESLEHVRSTVGLLRDGPTIGLAPTGAPDLRTLTARSQAAGVDATMRIDGDLADIDSEVGLGVYRVVQEALTNAGRHAPGARVDVRVSAGAERVVVRVANDRPLAPASAAASPAAGGAGLTGMRERIEAIGGTCSAGPDGDGGWVVVADLPAGARDGAGPRR